MTLPGGVLVKLNPDWTRQETDAFFKGNGIRPNRVRQLQLLDNTFSVDTPPGLASLQLANTLASQPGAQSAFERHTKRPRRGGKALTDGPSWSPQRVPGSRAAPAP